MLEADFEVSAPELLRTSHLRGRTEPVGNARYRASFGHFEPFIHFGWCAPSGLARHRIAVPTPLQTDAEHFAILRPEGAQRRFARPRRLACAPPGTDWRYRVHVAGEMAIGQLRPHTLVGRRVRWLSANFEQELPRHATRVASA